MARLPALVDAIEACDGRERVPLDLYARFVREAGFIRTTKRGYGAADMSPEDAANLLIALNVSETAKYAPEAVARYRALTLHPNVEFGDGEPLEVFRAIAACENFGEAFAALIGGMPEIVGAVLRFIDDAYASEAQRKAYRRALFHQRWTRPPFALVVTFSRFSAEILAQTWRGDDVASAGWQTEFRATFFADPDAAAADPFYDADRVVQSTITGKTLLRVWLALSGADHENPETLESPAVAGGGPR